MVESKDGIDLTLTKTHSQMSGNANGESSGEPDDIQRRRLLAKDGHSSYTNVTEGFGEHADDVA